MAWTETTSLSFTARHEASASDDAVAVLEALEAQRAKLEQLFPRVPANVTVILHDSALQLALAQPWLALARRFAAPAGRRYMAGWFAGDAVHALAPSVLRRIAAGPDSQQALLLTPARTYTLLVVGTSSSLLPPPFRPAAFTRLLRYSWLAEGAAQHFSGQLPHLRAAIARRLRGRPPQLPPSTRDAALLGGTVYDLLARERGAEACVRLALQERPAPAPEMIESAFDSSFADVRLRWRAHLDELSRARPSAEPERAPG